MTERNWKPTKPKPLNLKPTCPSGGHVVEPERITARDDHGAPAKAMCPSCDRIVPVFETANPNAAAKAEPAYVWMYEHHDPIELPPGVVHPEGETMAAVWCEASDQLVPLSVLQLGDFGTRAWCHDCERHVVTSGDGVLEPKRYKKHKRKVPREDDPTGHRLRLKPTGKISFELEHANGRTYGVLVWEPDENGDFQLDEHTKITGDAMRQAVADFMKKHSK